MQSSQLFVEMISEIFSRCPILIGRDVQMHALLIFLSIPGGISLFGFSGFVIGPIITSLLLAIWAMCDQFYRETSSCD